MNQIICTSNCNIDYTENKLISKSSKHFFRIQFSLLSFTLILLIIYQIAKKNLKNLHMILVLQKYTNLQIITQHLSIKKLT